MRGKFSTLSSVALMAMAAAALPTEAHAQAAQGGSVTLSAEQWQAIQQELAQLHADVNQLKAQQQRSTERMRQMAGGIVPGAGGAGGGRGGGGAR